MVQPRTHKRYDRDFKFSVVRPIASGEKSPTEICREHHLANSVLDRWRKEYDRLGESAFQPRQKWYRSRPVATEHAEEAAPTMTNKGEGSDANRLALLEQLCFRLTAMCGTLLLENWLLKQRLLGTRQAEPNART